MWGSQRCAARLFHLGAGLAGPFFRLLDEEMERREAPGALRYGAPMVPGISSEHRRTLPERGFASPPFGRVCETRPEARAGDDLKACEASPPNRCASRRSTGWVRLPASSPGALASSPAPLPGPPGPRRAS